MRHALLAGLMLLAIGSVVASEPGPRSLTFEDRVRAQAAIERVYYSHQLGATTPFEQAVPWTVLEAKVHKYLDQTAALEVYWKTAVTDEMLQHELERMASGTRMPERLLELYAALGNDPFLIKECLARATVVDRLTHNFYDFDTSIHAQARAGAEDLHRQLATGGLSSTSDHPNRAVIELVMSETAAETSDQPFRRQLPPEEFRRQRAQLPTDLGHVSPLRDERDAFIFTVVLSESPSDLRVASYAIPKRAWDDWWETAKLPLRSESVPTVATDRNRLPVSTASPSVNAGTDRIGSSGLPCALDDTWTPTGGAPVGREGHTAVWTGSLMVVWGGTGLWDGGDLHIERLTDGGRYDPTTDHWTPTSTSGAPSARSGNTAVWTGTEMIAWGGRFSDHHESSDLNTGGRYNPTTDTWTPTSTIDAPSVRSGHTAVWTGSVMVVWGGSGDSTGGRYDPVANTWTPTSTTAAPSARSGHTAVWTGSVMVVWGGYDQTGNLNTGGRYDPVADIWTPTSTTAAPTARASHTAVWTGSQMVVWGGVFNNPEVHFLNTGGRYDPATDTWTPMSTSGAPSERSGHTAVWTGSQMAVWGGAYVTEISGVFYLVLLNTGGRYDPATDTWTPMATTGAPDARIGHTAVWTGNLMVAWGGEPDAQMKLNSGGRYDPATDTWTPTSAAPPFARYGHSAVWTGTEMIVWGGIWHHRVVVPPTGVSGGRYDPATDTWTTTSTINAPSSSRVRHTAVWTGNVMVVWGGYDPSWELDFNTGGRYDPVADIWTPISTTDAPSARASHTAVWTGSLMVVWGGTGDSTGGRYDPVSNTWTPTSTTAAPSGRAYHTAVWTGSVMVVWGASGDSTGGRYDPVANTWAPTSTTAAPSARYGHTAVWTGSLMVVWGGYNQTGNLYSNTGGRYDPVANTWAPTSTTDAPSARASHAAVWTGSVMVVWGGHDQTYYLYFNTGGRYDPATDTWTPTSTTGAPPALNVYAGLNVYTAVWTGSEMIVWGSNGEWPFVSYGGRYVIADYDSDGTSVCQGDCDDANASVYPTAPEICDGLDNNCSGQVDEDAIGVDNDGDGVRNACDNCRLAFNPDQLEADGDGVGNACDNCLTTPNQNQSDTDSDGRGNACDNCALSTNSSQDDFDGDRVGDVCDNCIFDWNGTQTDFNHDGEGDICDLNDGVIYIYSTDKNYREWQAESGYTTWRSYRGSLAVLRATGQYTQAPGSNPLAARDCGVSDPYVFDPLVPNPGELAFNLVTGIAGGVESGLGTNSAGVPRANANPCP